MHVLNRTHVAATRVSGGRQARRWFGGDLVLLTTIGRRTGEPRTVTLMALRNGPHFLIAASHGGLDREPAWWLNLFANATGQLEVGGERFVVHGREGE